MTDSSEQPTRDAPVIDEPASEAGPGATTTAAATSTSAISTGEDVHREKDEHAVLSDTDEDGGLHDEEQGIVAKKTQHNDEPPPRSKAKSAVILLALCLAVFVGRSLHSSALHQLT